MTKTELKIVHHLMKMAVFACLHVSCNNCPLGHGVVRGCHDMEESQRHLDGMIKEMKALWKEKGWS